MTYDASADAAYVYLVPEIEDGESVRTTGPVPVGASGELVLDLAADGTLLGIEVLNASAVIRASTLQQAEQL